MPFFSYPKIDGGIITNLPTTSVVWSGGRNVAFKPGCVYKIFGKDLLATITNMPIMAMFTFKAYDNVWRTIVCCNNRIYSYTNNFTVGQDITPSVPPNSNSTDTWNFGMIKGMPVLSNGKNPPWKWNNFSTILSPIPQGIFTIEGIPSICKALHVINNRVVVGNIQEGGYAFPARLRWSDTIDVENWDRDLKLSSGSKDCVNPHSSNSGIDEIQAINNIGTRLIVFCERNIWIGTHAEFPEIYTFVSSDRDIGIIGKKALVKTPYGIFFIGHEDFYKITDTTPEAIGFRIRNSCFPNINKSKAETSFCYYKPSTREVVFCVPTGNNQTPDTAFVYQIETDSWTMWDVDYLCHTFYYDSNNMVWDNIPYGSWDNIQDSRWDELGTTGVLPNEVVGNTSGQILRFDYGNNNNGEAINSYIETGDIVLKNPDGADLYYINKIIQEIWLSMKPQISTNAIMVQVGTRNNVHDDIDWSQPSPYIIGVSRNVCIRRTGKYIKLRFYSDSLNTPWIMDNWSMKYNLGGTR